MQNRLFRQAALEKLSSPEELDQLMQVTTPRGWLALVGIMLLLATALVVAVLVVIPVRVTSQYCLFGAEENDPTLKVIMYVASFNAGEVNRADEVQIRPATLTRQVTGFLSGKITQVRAVPVTSQELNELLDNPALVGRLLESGDVIEVIAELTPSDELQSTQNGYTWLVNNGGQVTIESGVACSASIIVGQKRPIDLLLRTGS